MSYGSHPDSVANFRLIKPDRDYYFFGDDIIVHTYWEPIELVYTPRSGIEGLLQGLGQGIIECQDWTPDDIRYYFLRGGDDARSVSFDPVLPDLPQTNVQDAIEQLLTYTVTDQNHVHSNKALLDQITSVGSGKIITDAERQKLQDIEYGATRDQIASEVPFTPEGDIGSQNVQDAIEEVRSDTDLKLAGKSNLGHHHNAGDIDGLSDAIAADPTMHTHGNKTVLDQIQDAGSGQIITEAERDKLAGIEPGATRDQVASEVPILDSGNYYTSDNVESALAQLGPKQHIHANKTIIDQITSAGSGAIITASERSKLQGIEEGATRDQNASEVSFSPSGDITSNNVQQAIQEVRDDAHQALVSKTYHASNIGFSPEASDMPPETDNVQEAIENLDSRIDSLEETEHTHENKAVIDQIYDPGSGKIISAAERAKLNSIEPGATQDQSASEVPYSNASSNLDSTNVQDAIDEIKDELDDLEVAVKDHNSLTGLQGGTATQRYHLTQPQAQGLTQGGYTELHRHTAENTKYDHTESDLEAVDVQGAIDELTKYTKDIGSFGLFLSSMVSDQTIPSSIWTRINFNLVKENTFLSPNSLFTLDTSTGIITFHKEGQYEIYMSSAFDQIGYGTTRSSKLIHTNQFGSFVQIIGNNSNPATNDFTYISATGIFDVLSGDTLQVHVFQDNGSPLNLHSNWTTLTIKSAKDFVVSGSSSGQPPLVADHPHNALFAYYNAAEDILSGQVVQLIEDKFVITASNDSMNDVDKAIGVATQDTANGEECKIIMSGYMDNPTWNFIGGKPLFLDLDGSISQIYTPRIFQQVIGNAISQHELFINIQHSLIGFDPDDAGTPDINPSQSTVKYDNSVLTINNNDKLIYQFNINQWRTAKVVIQAEQSGEVQVSELLITHDGMAPFVTEYGRINNTTYNNDILDFMVQIVGNNLQLSGDLNVMGNINIVAQIILLPL